MRILTRGAADTDAVHACLDDEIDDAIEGREIDTAVTANWRRERGGESIHEGHVMLSRFDEEQDSRKQEYRRSEVDDRRQRDGDAETLARGDDPDDERRAAASGQPADRVHDAGGRAPRLGPYDVEHRREDVGIVEALEQPPHRECDDQHADRRRQPAHCHARRTAEHADRLDDEPASRRSTAPGVREPAADRGAGHARELDEERRGQARHAQAQMKLVVEKLGHPRQQHDRDEVGAHERAHQTEQRRRSCHQPEEAGQRQRAAPIGRDRRCPRAGSIKERLSTSPRRIPAAPKTTNDARQP